jgi:hypothetical protein
MGENDLDLTLEEILTFPQNATVGVLPIVGGTS